MDLGSVIEVTDFSGGMTDNYIEAALNRAQLLENYVIGKDRKPKTRPGLGLFYDEQIPAGTSRISALIKHRSSEELFVVSGRNIYYNDGSWQTLLGPVDSNPALSAGDTSNFQSFSDWRGHTVVCSDALSLPVKIYRDENSVYQVRTAGLPSVDLEGAIALANDIRSKFNAHIADGTQHTAGVDSIDAVISPAAWDFQSLAALVNELVTSTSTYPNHDADALLASGRMYHPAQESPSNALASTTIPTTFSQIVERLDDLKTKFNAHDANATTHAIGSLHQVSVSRSPTVSAGGSATYLYRFLYYYSYYVDDVFEEDFGPTTEVTAENAVTGTKTISNLPVLSNGTTNCYDTANIKIYVYRTVDAGSVFYFVGSVDNGTTTFSDTVSDADLILNPVLYTEGGVLDHDAPPAAKYFVAVNDIGVYAGLRLTSGDYPRSFITSIPTDIDSVPGSFEDEVEEDITGINSIQIYPILFCRRRIYRLEGIIDEQGRGSIQKKEISRTKGTVSNNSIVQIPAGLVWAGEDGFYFTDGVSPPQILSIGLIDTYKTLMQDPDNEKRISGEYHSLDNRVLWTCNRNSSNNDNDTVFVLDLNFPVTPDSVFTLFSGFINKDNSAGDSFRPTSLAYFGTEMVQSDSRGYVLVYSNNNTTDVKIDTTVATSLWNMYAIRENYKGPAVSAGTMAIKKYGPYMTFEALQDTNCEIDLGFRNDNKGVFTSLKEVVGTGLITWGDPAVEWGDPDLIWNDSKIIQAKRRFPAGTMRFNLKQIQITNAFTIIYNSDDYGTANVSGAANTAILSGVSPSIWPTDVVDYFLTFDADDYVTEYRILSRDSTTQVTFLDTFNTAPTDTTAQWEIKGYTKGHVIYPISYQIKFIAASATQNTYTGVVNANTT